MHSWIPGKDEKKIARYMPLKVIYKETKNFIPTTLTLVSLSAEVKNNCHKDITLYSQNILLKFK